MLAKAGLVAAAAAGILALNGRQKKLKAALRQREKAALSTSSTKPLTVMFWVQFVRGIGHLVRASRIARAMADNGMRVLLVLGGSRLEPLVAQICGLETDSKSSSSISIIQLPPCHIEDEKSWELLDENSKPVSEQWKAKRRDILLKLLRDERPDVLMLELFPFGRRKFYFELEPLLDAAFELDPRPSVLCSVRDVLVMPFDGAGAQQWAADKTRTYFDQVLVHGDSSLVSFGETFLCHSQIESLLLYTGYVVPNRGDSQGHTSNVGKGEIIVSAGGGSSGNPGQLFRTAAEARALCNDALKSCVWRFFVGWCVSDQQFQAWKTELGACSLSTAPIYTEIPGKVVVERARLNFPAILARCKASISQGGYNTVLETLNAGCPCVIVPIGTPEDQEQLIRARLIRKRLGNTASFQFVESWAVSAKALAEALMAATSVDARADSLARAELKLQVDGARVSAAAVLKWAQAARQRLPHALTEPLPIAVACQSAASATSGNSDAKSSLSIGIPATLVSVQPSVTVLLLHYRREENIRRILSCLERQTLRPQVFLWNNSGRVFSDPRITWQIDSSENRFCWPRWFMGSLAKTKYVCTMDDDLVLGDDRLLADMVAHMEADNEESRIVGFTGCVLHPDAKESYKNGFQVNANKFPWRHAHELRWQDGLVYQPAAAAAGAETLSDPTSSESSWRRKTYLFDPPWLPKQKQQLPSNENAVGAPLGESKTARFCAAIAVDVVKGRLMMVQRDALNKLQLAFAHDDTRGDDIAVSGMLANGAVRHHRVLRVLAGRVKELPAPHALCQFGEHYEKRERVRRRFCKS